MARASGPSWPGHRETFGFAGDRETRAWHGRRSRRVMNNASREASSGAPAPATPLAPLAPCIPLGPAAPIPWPEAPPVVEPPSSSSRLRKVPRYSSRCVGGPNDAVYLVVVVTLSALLAVVTAL